MELLAPAGDIERLKMALLYGADAVYIGGKDYSLRANAKNFSIEEIKESCEFAHKLNKKVYVTVNIVFHDKDLVGLEDYLKSLKECDVDAVIVSDIIGITQGSLFDSTQTMVAKVYDDTYQVQVVSWYDNENSYTSQMVRTIKYFAELG